MMASLIDSFFIDMIDRSFYYIPQTLVVAFDRSSSYDIRLNAQEIKDFDIGWGRGCINYGYGMNKTLMHTSVRILPIRIKHEFAKFIRDACFDDREEDARDLAVSLYDRAKKLYEYENEEKSDG